MVKLVHSEELYLTIVVLTYLGYMLTF